MFAQKLIKNLREHEMTYLLVRVMSVQVGAKTEQELMIVQRTRTNGHIHSKCCNNLLSAEIQVRC